MTIFDAKRPGISFIRFFVAMGFSWFVIVFALIELQQ